MQIYYKLRATVEIHELDDSAVVISTTDGSFFPVSKFTTNLVRGLQSDWLTDEDAAESDSNLSSGFYSMIKMRSAGMVDARVVESGNAMFAVSPSPDESLFKDVLERDTTYRLNRFAYLRQVDGNILLESPLTPCRITIYDDRLSGLIYQLCAGLRLDIAGDTVRLFLSLLVSLGFTEKAEPSVEDDPMDIWEFHDLLFHARTLGGKNAYHHGGTYRFKDKLPSPPVFRDSVSSEFIELPEPSDKLCERLNEPFSEVLSVRCSKREFSNEPLTLDELGAFLYTSARVKSIKNDFEHEGGLVTRPFPSGGGRHSLEIYPLIRDCRGVEAGLYRYDPQNHRLERINTDEASHQKQIEENPFEAIGYRSPQVTLNISTRIGRTAWKYESIAYKLINQDLGCLYQTFYMVATALALAPCALGSIDAKKLGEAHSIDWRDEPFIGAFALGK